MSYIIANSMGGNLLEQSFTKHVSRSTKSSGVKVSCGEREEGF